MHGLSFMDFEKNDYCLGPLPQLIFLSVISSMVVYLGRLGQQELNHLTFSKAKKVHIQYNIRKLYSAIS